jgi:uncharacterized protein (TIGR02444 family)
VSLWEWALKAYAADDVSETCLALQDVHGQNVCLLLYAGWCASTGRSLDEDDVEAATDTARVWADTAITPLRLIRRDLKTRRPDMDDAAREAVRSQIKAVELAAERRLLEALESLAPTPSGSPEQPLKALVAVSRNWGETVPRPALTRLADALPA